jgi:hypothetical protein
MFQRSVISSLLGIAAMCLWPALASAGSGPPTPDLDNISAYRLALEHSGDPQSKAILLEIANGPANLAAAKAAALKDGIRLTAGVGRPSKGGNAAALYKQWYQLYNQPGSWYPNYACPLTLQYGYTPGEIAAVQAVVDEHKSEDELLFKAIRTQTMDAASNSPEGKSSAYLLLNAVRQVRTEASLLALKDEWRPAVDLQLDGFAILRQANQDKSVMGFIFAITVEATTMAGLRDILGRSKPNAGIGRIIISAVASARSERSLNEALQGDPVSDPLARGDLGKEFTAGSATDQSKMVLGPADYEFFEDLVDAGEARYVNSLNAAVEAAGEPPMQRRVDIARLDSRSDSLSKRFPDDPLTVLFGGALDYRLLVKHDDVMAAREQVLLAAATVLSDKARTGVFPRELPGRFIDPFTDKQLVYRSTNTGFVVHSVGPTGHFDGNMTPDKAGWESGFQYPAPPPVPVPKDLR